VGESTAKKDYSGLFTKHAWEVSKLQVVSRLETMLRAKDASMS
jgi:hypothetical protein